MKKEIRLYMNNGLLDIEKVINEYSNYVRKIIQNMTNCISAEDVEEILSDTFLILWKNSEKLDLDKQISSYIAGITRNLVREKTRVVNFDCDISNYENIISDLKKVDMMYEEREINAIIKKNLMKFKEEDINIFSLYYYSSKKIREIASILGVSEFKVKSRLHRIRKKIKIELEKGGYSYGG